MRWLLAVPLILSMAVSAAVAQQPGGRRFPVFFAPMQASLGHAGQQVVASAARYAKHHRNEPITLVAYGAPPGHHYVEPADIDAQRAATVTGELIADGVSKTRIATIAKGPVQPNVPMSKIEVRRVDIIVGQPGASQ